MADTTHTIIRLGRWVYLERHVINTPKPLLPFVKFQALTAQEVFDYCETHLPGEPITINILGNTIPFASQDVPATETKTT